MEFYENILNNSSSMEVEASKNKGFLACMDPLDEALLLGSRDLECLAKSLEVKNWNGEVGVVLYPWINRKYLWFCKNVGISVDRHKNHIHSILDGY